MTAYRRRLYGSIIALVGYFCFFWPFGGAQVTYAADGNPARQAEITEHINTRTSELQTATKLFYIVLRPAIAAAGLAMDNSLVYGESLGFDIALWNLRNLTKNIANYALWFLFLYALFELLINKKQPKDMAKVIQSTLVAGVLIQTSRFITAAAVDISSIATYGIGGLPISIIDKADSDGKLLDIPVLGTEVISNMHNFDESTIILSTKGKDGEVRKISPCYVRNYVAPEDNKKKETLILGSARLYYINKDGKPVITKYDTVCHYMGNIYRYKNNDILYKEALPITKPSADMEENSQVWKVWLRETQQNYTANIDTFTATLNAGGSGKVLEHIKAGEILQIPDTLLANTSRLFTGEGDGLVQFTQGVITGLVVWPEGYGMDVDIKKLSEQPNITLTKISELFEQSKSYVGVFSALYGNLLDSAEFGITADTSPFSIFLNSVTTALYAAVLLIPLLVLVVVLFGRIMILWLVIAISPLIILFNVFGERFKWLKQFSGDGMFSLPEIGKILIAPVLVSFAVSLSTMFVMIIKNIVAQDSFNMYTPFDLGIIEINIRGGGAAFSALLVSMMGIGLVRFLLFWAIKANQIGKKIGGTVQKRAQDRAASVPIIPIPDGKGGVNFTGAKQAADMANAFIKTNKTQIDQKRQEDIADALEGTAFGKAVYGEDIARLNNKRDTVNNDLSAAERRRLAIAFATDPSAEHTANYWEGNKISMTKESFVKNADNIEDLIEVKTSSEFKNNAQMQKNIQEMLTEAYSNKDIATRIKEAKKETVATFLRWEASDEVRKSLIEEKPTLTLDGKQKKIKNDDPSVKELKLEEVITSTTSADLSGNLTHAQTKKELDELRNGADDEQKKTFIKDHPTHSRKFNNEEWIINQDKNIVKK